MPAPLRGDIGYLTFPDDRARLTIPFPGPGGRGDGGSRSSGIGCIPLEGRRHKGSIDVQAPERLRPLSTGLSRTGLNFGAEATGSPGAYGREEVRRELIERAASHSAYSRRFRESAVRMVEPQGGKRGCGRYGLFLNPRTGNDEIRGRHAEARAEDLVQLAEKLSRRERLDGLDAEW